MIDLSIYFKAAGEDCPSSTVVILRDMGKTDSYYKALHTGHSYPLFPRKTVKIYLPVRSEMLFTCKQKKIVMSYGEDHVQ